MKWFKHKTDARRNDKIARAAGRPIDFPIAYTFYFHVIETIAERLKPTRPLISARMRPSQWANELGISRQQFTANVDRFRQNGEARDLEIGQLPPELSPPRLPPELPTDLPTDLPTTLPLIYVTTYNDATVELWVPKLLESLDNHTKNSQVTNKLLKSVVASYLPPRSKKKEERIKERDPNGVVTRSSDLETPTPAASNEGGKTEVTPAAPAPTGLETPAAGKTSPPPAPTPEAGEILALWNAYAFKRGSKHLYTRPDDRATLAEAIAVFGFPDVKAEVEQKLAGGDVSSFTFFTKTWRGRLERLAEADTQAGAVGGRPRPNQAQQRPETPYPYTVGPTRDDLAPIPPEWMKKS